MKFQASPTYTSYERPGLALIAITAFALPCIFSLAQPSFAQNLRNDVNLCAAGAPCFTNEQQNGNTVTFWWNGGGDSYDVYNVRYAVTGGEKQVENRSGHYMFTNTRPHSLYKISVQGCNKHTFGHSTCSSWVQDSIRTR